MKLELKKKLRLLRDEHPGLMMIVLRNSLGVMGFGDEAIEKNQFLVEKVKALQTTATNEKAP